MSVASAHTDPSYPRSYESVRVARSPSTRNILVYSSLLLLLIIIITTIIIIIIIIIIIACIFLIYVASRQIFVCRDIREEQLFMQVSFFSVFARQAAGHGPSPSQTTAENVRFLKELFPNFFPEKPDLVFERRKRKKWKIKL